MHIHRLVLHIDTYERQNIVEMKDINRLNNMWEFDRKTHVHFMYTLNATNMDFGNNYLFNFYFRCFLTQAMVSSFVSFLNHTQRRTTVGRTPLGEWWVCRRDHYLSTQHPQQTNVHAPSGIRTHNLSRWETADICLRPLGHWTSSYNIFL